MPLLDQPDPSVLKPTLYSVLPPAPRVSAASQGPTAAMTKLAIDQQKQGELQQLAGQYLSDPNNMDYDGYVNAVSQKYPEDALRMKALLETSRKDHAETTAAQSKATAGMLDAFKPVVRAWTVNPTSYTPDARSQAVQQITSTFGPTYGSLADQSLPQPGDPNTTDKLENVYRIIDSHADFLKDRADAFQTYANGKLVEGTLKNLAIADTPDKWAIAAREAKGGGTGDLVDLAGNADGAKAMLAKRQGLEPQKAESEGSDFKQYATKVARDMGKTYDDLTSADMDKIRAKYSKDMVKPAVVNMGAAGPMNVPEIKPGTALYRTAQDLAYGKLTFQGFRTLAAYSRDAGTKFALYDTARQLNPNFNQAAFEMGYKYAGNPKTQNTLVSIDNALSNFDKAVDVSNSLDRTDLPSINRLLASGKFQFGNRPVTNFQQLQTILGDDIALAIGQGAPSDYKTKLAQSLLNGNLSKENFISTLRQAGEFLQNRKQSILKQEGIYGTPEFNPSAAEVLPKVMGGTPKAVNPKDPMGLR